MPTNTTNYSFYKPTVNGDENSWGIYLNYNWEKVDTELQALSTRINSSNYAIAGLGSQINSQSSLISTLTGQVDGFGVRLTESETAVEDLDLRIGLLDASLSTVLQIISGGVSSGVSLTEGSVVTAYLASAAVTTAKIADDAVTAPKIATAAVTPDAIATSAVQSRHIAAGAVVSAAIQNDAVTATHILDGSIGTQHINQGYVLVPKPGSSDGDKTLYNDDNYGLIWRRQNRVTQVTRYADLFLDTDLIEPGDLLVVQNGGVAGGTGVNDYPSSVGGVATPASIDANSVFLANQSVPSSPAHYTVLYTGSNGVVDVDTSDPLRAVFLLEDGSSYTVNLPQYSVSAETEMLGAAISTNDYTVVHDRSLNQQRKITLQELGIAMGWGATTITGGDGAGIINTLGIILGFEVDTGSGYLNLKSTGGFSQETAYIDSSGQFILVG